MHCKRQLNRCGAEVSSPNAAVSSPKAAERSTDHFGCLFPSCFWDVTTQLCNPQGSHTLRSRLAGTMMMVHLRSSKAKVLKGLQAQAALLWTSCKCPAWHWLLDAQTPTQLLVSPSLAPSSHVLSIPPRWREAWRW